MYAVEPLALMKFLCNGRRAPLPQGDMQMERAPHLEAQGLGHVDIFEAQPRIQLPSPCCLLDGRTGLRGRQDDDLLAGLRKKQRPIPSHARFRAPVRLAGKGGKQDLQAIASSAYWTGDDTNIIRKENSSGAVLMPPKNHKPTAFPNCGD